MSSYLTEAEEAKLSQKRATTVSALLVAGILHAIVLLIFAGFYLAGQVAKEPDLIIQSAPGNTTVQSRPKDFSTMMKEAPAASSSMMSKVVTSDAVSNVLLPSVPEVALDTVDFGVGFGDGFGTGMGGAGSGSGGFPPPGSPIRDRCSQKDREKRLAEGGGSPATEAAVVKALEWLANQQAPDGSWGSDHKVAMTGLSLLSLLGHCETYDSPRYAETVRSGIFYLIEKALQENGALRSQLGNGWVYEHGIGTYALCEAYSLIKYGSRKFPHMEPLKEAIEKAVKIIIEGQNHDGGWLYEFAGSRWAKENGIESEAASGDTSVAGWQLQALKAASLTGLEFRGISKCVRDGIQFIQSMQGPKGGFGYRGPADTYTLTGVGALCQQMLGSANNSSVRKGVDFFLETPFKLGEKDSSIYAWYYGTQACFQRGGREWKKWNDQFHDPVVKFQNADGSWPSEGGEGAASSGAAGGSATIYRTCLFTLMLEVYYRYLPATEK